MNKKGILIILLFSCLIIVGCNDKKIENNEKTDSNQNQEIIENNSGSVESNMISGNNDTEIVDNN